MSLDLSKKSTCTGEGSTGKHKFQVPKLTEDQITVLEHLGQPTDRKVCVYCGKREK